MSRIEEMMLCLGLPDSAKDGFIKFLRETFTHGQQVGYEQGLKEGQVRISKKIISYMSKETQDAN
jgi:hypothetical protein